MLWIRLLFGMGALGVLMPDSAAARTLSVAGTAGLLIWIGLCLRRYGLAGLAGHPWRPPAQTYNEFSLAQTLGGMAKLRLHYLFMINLALCLVAFSKGARIGNLVGGIILPLACLFMIGQDVATGKCHTNHGTFDRHLNPFGFRLVLFVTGIAYVLTSWLPFAP
jgi:hypothetical protein